MKAALLNYGTRCVIFVIGHKEIDRQHCAFKDYKRDHATQPPKERNGERGKEQCAVNICHDLAALLIPSWFLEK